MVASINRHVGERFAVFVTFLVECKFLSRPWVAFVSPRRLSPLFYFSRILGEDYSVREWREHSTFQGRLLARILSSLGRQALSSYALYSPPHSPGYGIRGAFKGKDHAYEALMQVSKSVEAYDMRVEIDYQRATEEYEERIFAGELGRGELQLTCSIAFPVVVGKGRLFECCLDAQNEIAISEVSESVVLASRRSYGAESVVGPSPTTAVRILTERRLPSFADEAFRAADLLLSQESVIEELWNYEHQRILEKSKVDESLF